MKISKIRAGEGFAGSYRAVIYAPEKAPPGSMCSLTQYLTENDMRVLPGYEGPERTHVLRVSWQGNASELIDSLGKPFTEWQQAYPSPVTISLSPKLVQQPLDIDFDHAHSSLRDYSGNVAGLAYMAGNLALVASALYNPTGKAHPVKLAAASLYTGGAAVLALFAGHATDAQGAWDVVQRTYPLVKNSPNKHLTKHTHSQVDKVVSFLKHYPWETQALLSTAGLSLHLASATGRKDRAEMGAVTAGIVSSLVQMLVPEKGGRKLLDVGDEVEAATDHFADDMHRLAQKSSLIAPLINSGFAVSDFIHENPLKATIPLGIVSSLGYIRAGRNQSDPRLKAAGLSWLTGNMAQLISSKGRGASLDDVVSAVVESIDSDKQLAHASPRTKKQMITALANELAEQDEIMHSSKRITKAAHRRLDAELKAGNQSPVDAYLPSEHAYLRESPFCESTTPSSFRSRIQNNTSWNTSTTM